MENQPINKPIIYSGIQPTGIITIGNYIGAISNWLKFMSINSLQLINLLELCILVSNELFEEQLQ